MSLKPTKEFVIKGQCNESEDLNQNLGNRLFTKVTGYECFLSIFDKE